MQGWSTTTLFQRHDGSAYGGTVHKAADDLSEVEELTDLVVIETTLLQGTRLFVALLARGSPALKTAGKQLVQGLLPVQLVILEQRVDQRRCHPALTQLSGNAQRAIALVVTVTNKLAGEAGIILPAALLAFR